MSNSQFINNVVKQIETSLNGSHKGSKNYTVDSLSQNRCQRPLTNCHTAETARKDGGEMILDLAIFPIFICHKMVSGRDKCVFKTAGTPLNPIDSIL